MKHHLAAVLVANVVTWSVLVAVVTSYTPNHYYPAMRQLNSRFLSGRNQQQSPDTSPQSVNRAVVGSQLIPRPRRLMGIFRCYGWGPGCTNGATTGSTPAYQMQQYAGGLVSSATRKSPSSTSLRSPNIPDAAALHRTSIIPETDSMLRSLSATSTSSSRFQPFFSLTSSGSWGPTGKKRHLSQRYTASDKRIDFLKQILQDMLGEPDSDEDEDDRGEQAGRRTISSHRSAI